MREKMNVMVEKKNGKGIGAKRFAVGVLILCLAFSLCACGKKGNFIIAVFFVWNRNRL